MSKLKTSYMGLTLSSPIVAASTGLTSKIDNIKQIEDAGAGAVVLKSLFEEQILFDSNKMTEGFDLETHADALDFFKGMSNNYFLDEYLTLVEESKKAVNIPVIASVNCISGGAWLKYAKRFQNVGADALEINIFKIPVNKKLSSEDYENAYLNLAREIKEIVDIPVSFKISPHFTSLARFIEQLSMNKLDSIVLFNRFYRPDVDINKIQMTHAPIYSAKEEISLALQWIALLSGEIKIDFVANTGIYDSTAVIKQLLVGAKAVQIASALYKNGFDVIRTINKEIENWMDEKNYSEISEFNGLLCQENSKNPEAYERTQYMKASVNIS